MSRQLSFDLPRREALGRDAFYVSGANALAVTMIESWRNWAGNKLLLTGASGAGKTHLAHVWAALSGARIVAAADLESLDIPSLAQGHVVIEDAGDVAGLAATEEALFHLHNLTLAEGNSLLLTARSAPQHWNLQLADLASRMLGTHSVTLQGPDDALLAAVLVKLFSDRQLAPTPETISFLTHRMERSFANAREVVARLDAAALAEGHQINRRLVSRVLAAMQIDSEPETS